MMNNNAGSGGGSSSSCRHGGLPPGYRFKPSDEEMMHHLFHKINTGVTLMTDIKDVNLYDYGPETLASMYPPLGDKEWYFFTPTQRKYRNGKKPDRSAGNGFWRAMTADTHLKQGGQTIGRKLTLVYHSGNNKQGVRSSWMMHEFRVERHLHVRTHANDMTLVDWVLCKVYQNARKVNLNRAGKTQATATQIFRVPAAAGGEEFNNGGAHDSRALINQRQFHHQTMLFDQAVVTEFNNNIGSSSSGSMMMVGQEYINPQHYRHHHHHPNSHQTVFDHNNQASAAAGGRREEFNDNVYAGCMMEAEDMGTLFNPPNYYNPYLDKTSLFNKYVNRQAAAGGGSQEFNNGKYSSYFGECSSSSSSNIVNVEAQGFYNGNGSGKAILQKQEDYCPPSSSLDQIVYDKNITINNVEASGNEEFYINGRGHCMMQGERVEMGEDLRRRMMMKVMTPPSHHRPPSN